jgi:hypothetical protein
LIVHSSVLKGSLLLDFDWLREALCLLVVCTRRRPAPFRFAGLFGSAGRLGDFVQALSPPRSKIAGAGGLLLVSVRLRDLLCVAATLASVRRLATAAAACISKSIADSSRRHSMKNEV